MASPLLRRRGPRYSSAHGLNIFASYSYTGGPVRDLKTRAWLDRLARRRDAAMASNLVALGPPSQHGVGLLRRVDHRAASRTAGGTPSPRNTETAWRCRHGLLASDRLRTDRFRGQALSVHSKTCFRDRSQQLRGPRVRPEIVEIDPVGVTACLCGHTPLMLQSFVCPKLPLGPLVSLYDALRQWF